jgi:hypothetical protein
VRQIRHHVATTNSGAFTYVYNASLRKTNSYALGLGCATIGPRDRQTDSNACGLANCGLRLVRTTSASQVALQGTRAARVVTD